MGILTLDYSKLSNFQLVGFDIDPESLSFAQFLAKEKGLHGHTSLFVQDAWKFDYHNKYDLITSNGLNVYESDPDKVLHLYTRLLKALKPGGTLITGVLTHLPKSSVPCEWQLDKISEKDLLLENTIFNFILGCKWYNFRSSEEIYSDFHKVGFDEVSIHYDEYHIFPTVVAKKK